MNILDSRSRASPASSTSSDHPPIFDIGLPPRQDHRSSFAAGPSHSMSGSSRRPSPSTASTAHSESDPTSPVNSRHIHTQPPLTLEPNQNWENYAIQIRHPEGGAAYQCTWITSEGPCHYWSKKQLVKRHVETTHLKFKCVIILIPQFFGSLIFHNAGRLFATSVPKHSHRYISFWSCPFSYSSPACLIIRKRP